MSEQTSQQTESSIESKLREELDILEAYVNKEDTTPPRTCIIDADKKLWDRLAKLGFYFDTTSQKWYEKSQGGVLQKVAFERVFEEADKIAHNIAMGLGKKEGNTRNHLTSTNAITELLKKPKSKCIFGSESKTQANSDPRYIGFAGQLFNLETRSVFDRWTMDEKQLEEYDSILCTMNIPTEYVEGATCPNFDSFLAERIGKQNVEAFWACVGSCLVYDRQKKMVIVNYSEQPNRYKSTVWAVLKAVIGEENTKDIQSNYWKPNKYQGHTDDVLANMGGVMVAHSQEFGKITTIAAETVKSMTSGQSISTSARAAFRAAVEVKANALLYWETNAFPRVNADEEALMSRLVPFEYLPVSVNYPREMNPTDAPEYFADEFSGILNRLLDGYTRYKNDYAFVEYYVKTHTKQMKDFIDSGEDDTDIDMLLRTGVLIEEEGARAYAEELDNLHARYLGMKDNPDFKTAQSFKQAIGNRWAKKKTDGKRYYSGVKVGIYLSPSLDIPSGQSRESEDSVHMGWKK